MTGPAYNRILDALRDRGHPVKTYGTTARTTCPGHDGDNPTALSVRDGDTRVSLTCHTQGCDGADILDALGLTIRDRYHDPKGASYTYTDPAGQLLRTVTRTPDKRFRQSGQTKGASPLYRLPQVIAAVAAGQTVHRVEGEEDVHALETLGLVATTAPQGANSVHLADFAPLAGATVVAVVDRDDAGDKWAAAVADKLDGIATDVTFVHAATGKDADDHVTAGHGPDDFVPVKVESADPVRRVVLTPASTIKPRPVRWLWDGRLALGTLGLLAGREGLGKSTLGYWLAARITRGELPGEYHGHPAGVLVAATEDSWEHTIVPRLMAAGADLDRVFRIDVEHALHGTASLSLPRDLGSLESAAAGVDAALLLLDPLTSRLGDLDTHKDAEVRQALEPLVAIADRVRMAVLGLMHHNKSGSVDPLQLIMASKAFTAVARSVHTVVPDPDDENVRLFGTPKNNLGTTNLPTLTFTIASAGIDTDEGTAWTGQLAWGEERRESIRDAMSRATPDEDKSATDEAADWLADFLTQGTVSSADAKRAGRAAGHGDKVLRRARERLRVEVESRGFPRVTYWTMPVVPSGAPSSARASVEGTTDATGPDLHSHAPQVVVVPSPQSPQDEGHDCEGTTAECARPNCTDPARPDRSMCPMHRTYEPSRRSA